MLILPNDETECLPTKLNVYRLDQMSTDQTEYLPAYLMATVLMRC